jgi:hypoxanthine phosphoribosyltransferase
MMDFISKVLLSKDEIADTVKRLGKDISMDYDGKNLLMISLLKGAVVFMADLMREVTIPCKIDFMAVSSYTGVKSSGGNVNILMDLNIDIKDFDVLIVEDILESGYTLKCVTKMLEARNPKSIKICTLLDKPDSRKTDIEAQYVGRKIPGEFVIGYGLDYNEQYRNLPFIGVLNPKYI